MRIARDRGTTALEAALNGAPLRYDNHDAFVSLAGELRQAGLDLSTLAPSPARREELRVAVLAQRARNHRNGGLARARGAVVGVAAIAGAGLVAASAATGSNPAVLVVEAAREFPKLNVRGETPASMDIEGEVVATHDGGRTLEVRGADDTVIVVHAPRESRAVTEAGTPVAASNIAEGATIRVTADRDGSSGPIEAKKIEVVPAAGPRAEPTLTAALLPDSKPTLTGSWVATATATARPSSTKTASPTPTVTPKPVVTNVAIIPALDPAPPATASPTPTPTRKPEPTRTPATTNVDPAPLEKDESDFAGDNATAE